jgi:hypothetical protein
MKPSVLLLVVVDLSMSLAAQGPGKKFAERRSACIVHRSGPLGGVARGLGMCTTLL